ncbi:MAG TPA: hypothetical protein VGR52_10710 [Stellaceae bacterium]|nr:hypothetical protein [Stellaceae bacterium]
MTAIQISGLMLSALSAVVLFITMRTLVRSQGDLAATGIYEPIPLDVKARMIIWVWTAAFVVGVMLTCTA